MSISGFSAEKNKEQAELERLIREKYTKTPIVIAIGNAGTGKNYCAIGVALDLVLENKTYEKIIYAREPVEVGKSIGFLPGEQEDKMQPYLAPLYDNLERLIANKCKNKSRPDKQALKNTLLPQFKKVIECTPIQYMRGRTFENTILIVDEAQNLPLTSLKTVLTRMGEHCKIILIGSYNQIDTKGMSKYNNDFKKVVDKIKGEKFVGYIELVDSMRSPLCAKMDDLLSEIDN